MAEIAATIDDYAPSGNEAQTEHDLVRPILTLLGHGSEVQAPPAAPDGTKGPDYVFYHDQTALLAKTIRAWIAGDAVRQLPGL